MGCTNRLSASDLAGYLDGDLTPQTRDRVEAHLDRCPDCWVELVTAARLREQLAPPLPAPVGHRPRWIRYAGLAVAAGLAGLVVIPAIRRSAEQPRDTARTSSSDPRASSPLALRVIAPVERAEVEPTAATFTWHGATAGLYRFTLLTETGEPAWTVETTDTVVRLPSYLTLRPGLYFWRVDAVQDGLSTSSGIHRVQIAP